MKNETRFTETKFSNQAVARILREVAAAYEAKNEDLFKIRAYRTASESVEHATSEVKDLWEEGRLSDLPGVGKSIASHLDEYFRTGRVKHFEKVKKGLPPGMFNILELEGVGPKTAHRLAKELYVETVEDLKEAAEAGKIRALEGFGETSEKDILNAIEKQTQQFGRMLLPSAFSIAQKIIGEIEKVPGVKRADPLGSLRRMVSTVGDVDIGVATTDGKEVIERFVEFPDVSEVLAKGGAKASVKLKTGRQVDIRVHDPKSYGALLQYFTGSKAHNIHLRSIAKLKGLSLSEYGVKNVRTGKTVSTATEEEFYKLVGLKFIPPELREDTGEIEAAQKNKLPKLVELMDIKGDLHLHTTHSDGQLSCEEMVKAALEDGLEYIGISDHTPSVSTRGEREVGRMMEERKEEIDLLREKYPSIKILFGAEVIVDAKGEMALPDSILSKLDYAVGAIHTSFDQPRKQITKRLLTAVEHPNVRFIAHPTGRLLGEREAYDADWDTVLKAVKDEGKFLEINSFPSRLDLVDTLVRRAKDIGIKMLINTDSHHSDHMKYREFGAAVARRGWCEKEDIINTLPYKEFEKVFLKGVNLT